jgi:hypothetical protein
MTLLKLWKMPVVTVSMLIILMDLLARVRKLIAILKFHQNLIRTCSRITPNTWCNNTVGNRAKIRTFAHISNKLIGKNREW